MKRYRGQALVRVLAESKVDALVGVQTFPHSEEEWNVMIAPQQIINVTELAMRLHFRGFALMHGPVDGAPVDMNGKPADGWVIVDTLQEALPEAEEVEFVSPEDVYREVLVTNEGEPIGWVNLEGYATRRRPQYGRHFTDPPAQTEAKTGGEGIWEPGP